MSKTNKGFVKPALLILFVVLIFAFFSIIRSTLQSVADTEEMNSYKGIDPNTQLQ